MTGGFAPEPIGGPVEAEIAEEFPGLRLTWMNLPAPRRSSPPGVARRLAELSNRFHGSDVVAMRSQPVPRAFRTFFRQIGLDPDVDRIPIEQAALGRLQQGRFRSRGTVPDALLIALVETGVGVWAIDAARMSHGGLGIRTSVAGDRLGTRPEADHLPPGRLVVADAETVHAVLFGPVAPGHEPTDATGRLTLWAVAVDGVPAIHIEEALWICSEVIAAGV